VGFELGGTHDSRDGASSSRVLSVPLGLKQCSALAHLLLQYVLGSEKVSAGPVSVEDKVWLPCGACGNVPDDWSGRSTKTHIL